MTDRLWPTRITWKKPGKARSSLADLTPVKEIAVASTWLTMHIQPPQGRVRDGQGVIEREGGSTSH